MTSSEISKEEIKQMLLTSDVEALFKRAYAVKMQYVSNKVYFRGIIEFSNICRKDCYYCGIRKSNEQVKRYFIKEQEIIESARWAYENKFGSIVLQSGEREDEYFINFIENVIRKIKEVSDGKLGITLSLGEQERDVYDRWFKAGAHRYLLRIETSNPELYKKLHPQDHSFERRLNCLMDIKKAGYQVGTGVMIGLPFQTIDNLVDDLLFFKEIDIDMIGMGPYIFSQNTPLAENFTDYEEKKNEIYWLSLKMIAAARILLKNVNIAATTALQTLKPFGREMGLKAGANIIMPNITPVEYREDYQLYDNKPCLDEDKVLCRECLDKRIIGIDEEIAYGEWGDSLHFLNK